MNYYCLIAGLPDIQAEDAKGTTSLTDIKNEFLTQLSEKDALLLKLLYSKYDNDNLLTYMSNRDAKLHASANLTADDWDELIGLMKDSDNPKDERLLPYIHTFYTNIHTENFDSEAISKEDYLSGLYYEYAMKCDNKFLQNWFEFNLNVNNLLTAISCKKHGFDAKKFVIGENEIASNLRQSNARDFGLTGMFEHLETVLRIAEETDLLEREKKIDALKWTWIEENTFFNYFSVEKVLAYILKIEMIERWKLLSMEKGSQIFRDLLAGLKAGINFNLPEA